MIPISLLPHWFQRRYRVWRGWWARGWRQVTRCSRGTHEDVFRADDSTYGSMTMSELTWRCRDCGREDYIGFAWSGASNHKARRDA